MSLHNFATTVRESSSCAGIEAAGGGGGGMIKKLVNLARRHRSSTTTRTTVKVIIQCTRNRLHETSNHPPPSSACVQKIINFSRTVTRCSSPGGKFRAKFRARRGDNFRLSAVEEGGAEWVARGRGQSHSPRAHVGRIWRMAMSWPCPAPCFLTNDALMK